MYIPAEKLPEFLDNAEQKSLNDLTSIEMDLLKAHRAEHYKKICDEVDASPAAPVVADGEVPPAAKKEMRVNRNGYSVENQGRRVFRNGFLVSGEDIKNPNAAL